MTDEFKFSEVQLEFQSQPDDNSDDTDTSNQFSQKTTYDTLSQTSATSQSQEEPSNSSQIEETSETSGLISETDTNNDQEDDNSYEENYEQYDLQNLPAHACNYCGIHSPDCVIQCVDCSRWFCNNRGATTGAHIINHLVRAKHKRVTLHKDCLLGRTRLECFNCGGENIFLLGFIPAKANSIVVLLCREPCLTLNSLKEMNWDLAQWVPLIKDRAFLPWLVQQPHEREAARSLKLDATQLSQLEELWRSGNPRATVEDLQSADSVKTMQPVRARYDSAYDYENIFLPLVDLESDYEKRQKEEQGQEGVTVRWTVGANGRYEACFRLDNAMEMGARIVPGDEIILSYRGDVVNRNWKSRAVVLRITIQDEILVEIAHNSKNPPPITQTFGFIIEFVFIPIPYDRMKCALKKFARNDYSITGYLYHQLLGHEVEKQSLNFAPPIDINAPGLPCLNDSQANALRCALETPLSLIQGPPGTGKTVTTATLVYHLAQQKRGQLLVCAPSNIGVDQLAVKINATGLRVVRLDSRSRELVSSFANFIYLSTLVRQLAKESKNDLFKLIELVEMQVHMY